MRKWNLIRFMTVVGLLVTGLDSVAQAQQKLPPEIAKGLAQITEEDVAATVTFLASDEMAGRDTPSRELTIATAYVAARFRAAGLQGGAKGSFYQKHQLETVAMPSSGVEFQVDGQPASALWSDCR